MKSGNLNFLEPSGPLQACNGTDLPLIYQIDKFISGKVHGLKDANRAMFHQREEPGTSYNNHLLGENYTLCPQFRSHPNENNLLKVKASCPSETTADHLTKYASRHVLE